MSDQQLSGQPREAQRPRHQSNDRSALRGLSELMDVEFLAHDTVTRAVRLAAAGPIDAAAARVTAAESDGSTSAVPGPQAERIAGNTVVSGVAPVTPPRPSRRIVPTSRRRTRTRPGSTA